MIWSFRKMTTPRCESICPWSLGTNSHSQSCGLSFCICFGAIMSPSDWPIHGSSSLASKPTSSSNKTSWTSLSAAFVQYTKCFATFGHIWENSSTLHSCHWVPLPTWLPRELPFISISVPKGDKSISGNNFSVPGYFALGNFWRVFWALLLIQNCYKWLT